MASMNNTEAITMCDTVVDAVDNDTSAANPVLRIYSGTVPTNVDASLSGNTLLAELAMSNPAFGAAADAAPGATATANSISDDTSADATGTASFARLFDRQASPAARIQITAGEGSEELVLNSASITAGVVVSVTSLTITQPES